jgi:hypothetical protein
MPNTKERTPLVSFIAVDGWLDETEVVGAAALVLEDDCCVSSSSVVDGERILAAGGLTMPFASR